MSGKPPRNIEVLADPFSYENLPADYWSGRIAVVIDALRATSSMVTALAGGAAWILPCRNVEDAREQALFFPGTFLVGERKGLAPEGFHRGNSPLEFLGVDLKDKGLVWTTTNGTRALEAARPSEILLVASFLNLSATTEFLEMRDHPLSFVCSGTGEDFALEDALVAGAFLDRMQPEHPWASLYRSCAGDLRQSFRGSSNGKRLVELGLGNDIEWCLQKDVYPEVVGFHKERKRLELLAKA